MTVVCLDTQILIWGVQGHAGESQQFMIPRTKAFLAALEEKKTQILIPSVVVAEYLLGIPQELHPTTVDYIQKRFLTAPFDLPASIYFARIWQDNYNNHVYHTLRQERGVSRQELRADSMIVAIAKSRGAACIYSTDDPLRRFANGYIDVHDVPDIGFQLDLF